MEVLLLDGKILCLTGPEVEHRSDDIKRVPHAKYNFVGSECNLLTEWVVCLNKPTLIIDFALTAEATELKAVMECVVQITI